MNIKIIKDEDLKLLEKAGMVYPVKMWKGTEGVTTTVYALTWAGRTLLQSGWKAEKTEGEGEGSPGRDVY